MEIQKLPLAICTFGTIQLGVTPDSKIVENIKLAGDVKGKVAFITIDLEDTCEVLEPISAFLIENGAEKVYALCTHRRFFLNFFFSYIPSPFQFHKF